MLKGIKIFENTFLYTAYPDDSIFLKKIKTQSRNY